MIVASAVKLKDGRVFVGTRHGDCYIKMRDLGLKINECNNGSTQGFINDQLIFLTREEAYYEAFKNNQCDKQEHKENIHLDLKVEKENWKPCLTSEDLW